MISKLFNQCLNNKYNYDFHQLGCSSAHSFLKSEPAYM